MQGTDMLLHNMPRPCPFFEDSAGSLWKSNMAREHIPCIQVFPLKPPLIGDFGATFEGTFSPGETETWSKLLNAVGGSIGSISALELDSEDLAGHGPRLVHVMAWCPVVFMVLFRK